MHLALSDEIFEASINVGFHAKMVPVGAVMRSIAQGNWPSLPHALFFNEQVYQRAPDDVEITIGQAKKFSARHCVRPARG